MRALGHDLEVLLDAVTDQHYSGTDRPLVRSELGFLKTGSTLKRSTKILSDFGKKGRYYNLDVVAREKKQLIDPTEEW